MPHLWPTGSSRGRPHRLQPGTSPHALRIPPHDGHPALRKAARIGSRSALAVSRFRLRARLGFSIPLPLSGPRGITPAFGYGAPHPSARGTSTPLNNALLSAHYTSVRLLRCVHAGCAAFRLFPPVCSRFRFRRPGGLPVPVHEVSKRARALRLRGAVRRLACIAAVHVAFAVRYQLGAPDFFFRSSITRPTYAPVYASMAASRHATQDSGSGWIATSFPVRLFHSLLHAGFDRRTTKPIGGISG